MTATSTDAAVSAGGPQQSEPSFRAPPSEGGAAAAAVDSASSTRVALWTLGVGVLVVALALVFLRLMTNII